MEQVEVHLTGFGKFADVGKESSLKLFFLLFSTKSDDWIDGQIT